MENIITVQLEDLSPYNYTLHRIQSAKNWGFPRHRHKDVFEFYYLFEGELIHHFDEGMIRMNEGDFVSILEGDYHSLEGRNFDFFNLIIPVSYWERLLSHFKLKSVFDTISTNGRMQAHFRREEQGRILEDLRKLFLYQKTEYGDILLNRFFFTLAAEILGPPDSDERGEFRTGSARGLPLWLEKLMLEVDGRMDEQLTVGDLSRFTNKTPEHLSRSFRRYLNTTPSSWLNRLKMERASLMLEHSNTAVLDIALSLGFNNLGYFYRIFKKQYGLPPVEYRREHGRFHGV